MKLSNAMIAISMPASRRYAVTFYLSKICLLSRIFLDIIVALYTHEITAIPFRWLQKWEVPKIEKRKNVQRIKTLKRVFPQRL